MSLGKGLLWAALLLTIVAALWPLPESDSPEGALTRPENGRKRADAPNELVSPKIQALTKSGQVQQLEIKDLFPRQDWAAPAPSVPAESPVAPTLPFTFGGRYTEGGNTFVFLNEGTKMHMVREGDAIGSAYRIEKITPAAITLIYLPLGSQQTIVTGSTTPP